VDVPRWMIEAIFPRWMIEAIFPVAGEGGGARHRVLIFAQVLGLFCGCCRALLWVPQGAFVGARLWVLIFAQVFKVYDLGLRVEGLQSVSSKGLGIGGLGSRVQG